MALVMGDILGLEVGLLIEGRCRAFLGAIPAAPRRRPHKGEVDAKQSFTGWEMANLRASVGSTARPSRPAAAARDGLLLAGAELEPRV